MKRILAMSLGIFVFDQLTKYFVVQYLNLQMDLSKRVFPPFLNFEMAWNEGINLGLLADYDLRWLLIVVSVAISAWVLWWGRSFTGWFGAFFGGLYRRWGAGQHGGSCGLRRCCRLFEYVVLRVEKPVFL